MDHLDATGVGGDVAAHLAGAARGKIHRVEKTLLFGELLQLCGNHAGAAAHRAIDGIEVLDMVDAVQSQHQLTVAGNSAGTETGATARRHNGQLFPGGQPDDVLHLFYGRRQHDGCGPGRVGPGPVTAVLQQGVRVRQHPVRPDNALKRRLDSLVDGCHGGYLR